MKTTLMKPFEKAAVLFLLKHLASGAAGAIVLGLGILILDIARIGTLISTSEYGVVATIMLFFGLIVTFGSVAMGIGIMTLNEDRRP